MTNYDLVARAIAEINSRNGVVSVPELARALAVSESHLHRTFVEWAGIPPKAFAQFVVVKKAKPLLAERVSLFEASLDLGLSSPSRLYDAFIAVDGVTPGTFGSQGEGMVVEWGQVETPYGQAVLACSSRGVVGLQFGRETDALSAIHTSWPRADFVLGGAHFESASKELSRHWINPGQARLGLLLKGSPLRMAVWKALLGVPSGNLISYSGLAKLAGQPRAVRSVASAVASNPIAVLIPCHRVIRSSGSVGDYHWGTERKLAILASERAFPIGD